MQCKCSNFQPALLLKKCLKKMFKCLFSWALKTWRDCDDKRSFTVTLKRKDLQFMMKFHFISYHALIVFYFLKKGINWGLIQPASYNMNDFLESNVTFLYPIVVIFISLLLFKKLNNFSKVLETSWLVFLISFLHLQMFKGSIYGYVS